MTSEPDQPGPEAFFNVPRNMMSEMMKQWTSLATSARPSEGNDFAEQFQAFMGNAAAMAQATTRPLEDFLTAQRQFAAQMEQWAHLQKALAEQTMALAKRQQEIVDAVERWTTPLRGFAGGDTGSE